MADLNNFFGVCTVALENNTDRIREGILPNKNKSLTTRTWYWSLSLYGNYVYDGFNKRTASWGERDVRETCCVYVDE